MGKKPTDIPDYTAEFELFWKAFPKREGENSKWQAFLKYRQALKKITPETLLARAVEMTALHANTHPRFIPMASTWLFQRRWEIEHPTQATVDVGKDWDRICRFFKKTGQWLDRSPEPGYGGCPCPKAVLTAHGLPTERTPRR